MTPSELVTLKKFLLANAMYFGQEIKDTVLQMYAEDLEDLPLDGVVQAIKALRRDPKTFRVPLPAQIRARLCPPVTDEHEAVEASARIWGAIATFGWPNPDGARDHIGPLGWQVVERMGGWRSICDESNDAGPSMRAQMRELAKSIIARTAAGIADVPPGLPENPRLKLLITKGHEGPAS